MRSMGVPFTGNHQASRPRRPVLVFGRVEKYVSANQNLEPLKSALNPPPPWPHGRNGWRNSCSRPLGSCHLYTGGECDVLRVLALEREMALAEISLFLKNITTSTMLIYIGN